MFLVPRQEEDIKLSPFANEMILYLKAKKLHQNLLDTINSFSNVAVYKINL
jgi:hypothetical protein